MAAYEEEAFSGFDGEMTQDDMLKLFVLSIMGGVENNHVFRTRQIIEFLPSLDWFKSHDKNFPDLTYEGLTTKRYPMWLYKTIKPFLDKKKTDSSSFTTFGIFMEIFIKNKLYNREDSATDWNIEPELGEEEWMKDPDVDIYDVYRHVVKFRTGKDIKEVLSKDDFISAERRSRFFKKIGDAAIENLPMSLNFGEEIELETDDWTLQGHPDILGNDIVIDVKTVSSYYSKETDHLFQVLIYFVLLRLTNRPVKKIGIYLPLQSELVSFNLRKWDSSIFEKELLRTMRRIKHRRVRADGSFRAHPEISDLNIVGSHVGRRDQHTGKPVSISENLEFGYNILGNVPMQIYLRTQQYSQGEKISKSDVSDLKDTVSRLDLSLFIHAPLNINPSEKTYRASQIERIKLELAIGKKVGAKGVVMHVGKSKKMGVCKAIDTMRNFIVECLSAASKKCPLLLETPAGQGTELLTKFRDFVKFVRSIYAINKKYEDLFGVCVDTCHVFASGYEPDTYIKGFLNEFDNNAVRLIHFNDSMGVKGCCVDRHAMCGTGMIGHESLINVKKLAEVNGIPMVTE